jgi:hypothetical protein
MSAILSYLTGEADPQTLEQAVDELVRQQGISRLAAALRDQLTCTECQEQLAFYAHTQDSGQPLAAWQAVELHLSHCTTCRGLYADLQMFDPFSQESTAQGEPTPEPNLNFLRRAAEPAVSVWQSIETGHHQLAARVKAIVSRAAAHFAAWPAGLNIQPVAAPLLRDQPTTIAAQRLIIPNREGILQFEVTIYAADQRTQLTVGIFCTEGHAPVSQIPVSLLTQERQRLQRGDSDGSGLVHFRDLPPASYLIQVRTNQEQWEIGMELAHS